MAKRICGRAHIGCVRFCLRFRRDEAASAGGFGGVRAEKAKQQRDSIFFFIHLKFSQDTNKDYLYNQFVIFLI